MKKVVLAFSFLFTFLLSQAQIINGLDTLYGNEWIDFDQSYFKVMVAEDGMYELPFQQLVDAGVPMSQIHGSEFQLFHNGEEVPIFTTTDGAFGNNDRIEFFGKINTSELDRYMFENPEEEMMNPRYSLFTDTSAYFLTWTEVGTPLRYEEIQNDLNNLPPKEDYFLAEQEINLFSQHQKDGNSEGVRFSSFVKGTGFASNAVNVQTHTLTPESPHIGGPSANLFVRYSGNYGSHNHEISVNGNVLGTESYFGFEVKENDFEISNATLSNPLEIKFQGLVSNNDRCRVSNIILTYPKLFDASGASSFNFNLESTSNKKYIEVENFNFTGDELIAYDIINNHRIIPENNGGIIRLGINGNGEGRNIWMVNSNSGLKTVPSISEVDFIDYKEIDADFIFLSHPKLYDDGNGNNYVQEYADYRASNDGGNYNPIIVEIQQLYDQFSWGINRHSMSIRNFAHYVNKEWNEVKYFFILGKGREYHRTRTSSSLNNQNDLPLLVPTYGQPGSDNLLTAYNWTGIPEIPIGRFPAVTPSEIKNYLQKVKTFEANNNLPQTIEDRQWMKHVMHLGGGGDIGEQSLIRNNLESMGNILETNQFGATITSFYKTSSDPLQVSQTQSINDRINSGLSIMSFFGHSSASGFDFVVDDPASYENYGKYPVVFSLGCFSGQIHDSFRSIGESFVIQEDKGAIAFVASTGFGYITALSGATSKFYDEIGGNSYGNGIGDIMQKTIAQIIDNGFASEVLSHQFTIQGDPSLVINAFDGPDYVVDGSSVSIFPAQINAQQASADFTFTVLNLGKGIDDSLSLEILREFPNGSVQSVEEISIPAPKFQSEVSVTVPILGDLAVGFNRIYVNIDPENKIDEENQPAAENNNELKTPSGQTGFRFFVFSNGAIPVYPEKYSIVSDNEIVLKASTSNAFAPHQKYFFEIDTSEYFNSPIKLSTTVEQNGGVIKWTPNLNWKNNTVYYWRVAPDSIANQSFVWANSSFLYLENSRNGWNQSHFFQFNENKYANMELLEPERKLKFLDDVKTIRLLNGVYPTYWPEIIVNSESYYYLPWDNPIKGGMYIAVLDSSTIDPLQNIPPGLYGSHLSPWAYFGIFPFRTRTAEQREKVVNFLQDTIPSGNYVLLFTVQQSNGTNYEPEEWAADSLLYGTNLFQIFEEQGAQLIRGTEASGAMPYALMYKKDDPSFPIYEKVVGLEESIEEAFSLTGNWFNGYTESELIGPSQRWDSLSWTTEFYDPIHDREELEVYGVKKDSTRVLLFDNIESESLDLSSIDADEFPYMRLRYIATDSLERSSPHLSYWRVFYEGLPDAAVNPSELFVFEKDTLREGEELNFEMAIENLTRLDMDSLLLRFSVTNSNNELQEVNNRISPLLAEEKDVASFTLDTRGLSGEQEFWFEINPGLDQPEKHVFNNIAVKNFYVDKDRENPLVDVTFDGVRILNEDIVSPSPSILISVEDENEYLLLNDTSFFNVFLQYPDTNELTYIPFDGEVLRFIPASGGAGAENIAKLELNPTFTKDGTYNLIIQARDASDNSSGAYDYKISFRVITKASISNLLNYPNPFSTSTRFVYTLTGSEPPAQFKIQIMTIAGKIVREIGQDEIGDLKIGAHKTEYAWDGRDEFGDQLANGVYLYRVLAKKANGEDYELFENGSADQFFKNGFGKMVLVR